MFYPAMPQYGHTSQQQYEGQSSNNYQPSQSFGQPLNHSISQQIYGSNLTERPSAPQHYQSWSVPPPQYSEQPQQFSVCPPAPTSPYAPPPPPRPTPQPGFSAQLDVPRLQSSQYASAVPASYSNPRPASPLPSSEAEYRTRLESAGVTPQQIEMILGQPGTTQHQNHTDNQAPPTAALQNFSLNDPARANDRFSASYPFNLPEPAPMVFYVDGAKDNEDIFYVLQPKAPHSSPLYTTEWVCDSDRIRPVLTVRHHKDQDSAYSRVAGSCQFTAKHMILKFPWLEWGEWGQSSGIRTDHWDSDTRILNKKVMYWEKDMAHHGKPNIFVIRCKVTQNGLEDPCAPKPDDRVVVTVEVRPDGEADIITIEPGVIEKQDQLDEMLTVALAVQQKFHFDMAMWMVLEKGYAFEDVVKCDDLRCVPEDVDGWGGETGQEGTTAASKAAKKGRWKERAKTGAALGKLLGTSFQLGNQISIAASGGGGGGAF